MALYNAQSYLAEALDSILTQSYKDYELIIADGGSTDETISILEGYGDKIFFFSEPDNGVYDAWNKALRFAKGEWIMFVGGDDFFVSGESLSSVIPFLEAEKNAIKKYIYNKVDVISKDTKKTILVDGMEWNAARPLLNRYMSVPHCGAFHHKSLFPEIGYFNTGFRIAGDYDFLLRLVKKEKECLFLPFSIMKMREGGLSTNSRMRVVLARENLKALKMNGYSVGFYQYFSLFKAWILMLMGEIIGHNLLSRCIGIIKKR